MKQKITVVINTYNAEQHLATVLESVKDFDETVVCDMESTDSTRETATRYGCRVVTFPRGEHKICEPARDFAIHSASNSWVLVVDADEVVPATLRQYLYRRIDEGFEGALAVPRINLFMGEPAHDTGDYQLRFFRQESTVWPAVIHARPQVEGPVENVPYRPELCLIHLDNPSIASRIAKMNNYTDYEVPKRMTKEYGTCGMIFRPMWFFLRSWLLGKGFKEGRRGVAKAYMSAIYQMIFMSKLLEAKQNKTDRK